MGELFLELCVHGGLSVVLLSVEELVEASEDYFALLVEDKSSCGAQVGVFEVDNLRAVLNAGEVALLVRVELYKV